MRARWIWWFFGGVVVLPTLTYLAWSWRMEDLFVEAAERVRSETAPASEADRGPMPPLLRLAATLYDPASLPGAIRGAIPASSWTTAERDEVAAFLLAHRPCLVALDQAVEAGHGRFGLIWWNQGEFGDLTSLAQPLHARALYAGLTGDAPEALRSVRAAFMVTNALPPDSLLLFEVFATYHRQNFQRLEEIAGMPGFDAARAARALDGPMGAIQPRTRLTAAWHGERLGLVWWFDTIRRDHRALDEYSLAGEHWRKWSIARPLLFRDALRSIEFWNDAIRCLKADDRAGLESMKDRDDGLPEFLAPHSLSEYPIRQYRKMLELEESVRRARGALRQRRK